MHPQQRAIDRGPRDFGTSDPPARVAHHGLRERMAASAASAWS
jgi:hypothetical protein